LAERADEPVVDEPLGDPPADLDEAERARWLELAGDMPWLGRADRTALWAAAKQHAVLRKSGGSASEWAVFRGYLSDLGGMAGSRSKVKVPGGKSKAKANQFGALTA
jgi:hypothetical protein